MSNELEQLKLCRESVDETISLWQGARAGNNGQWHPTFIKYNWAELQSRMSGWWTAYKKWEASDTFYEAFRDKRMTVRTFPAGFERQRDKTFDKIDLDYDRFFADGQYTTATPSQQTFHSGRYNWPGNPEREKYWARRGIDSSPFANPANFISRDKKYEEGLHDLSASLLNPRLPIFKQVHNTEQGAHFSLLPLSFEEDQKLLYDLTALAKALQAALPPLHLVVRGYRAEMTRIKVAQELDMGTGYTIIPSPRPGDGPQYKLRYGLVASMTAPGVPLGIPVTAQVYAARRQAALKFKSILDKRDAKNEIIISIRRHAGRFPVYAIREGEELACYQIVNNDMERTGDVISADGRVTHPHVRERGAAGLPVTRPAAILTYNVPVSANAPVRSGPLPPSPQQGGPPPPPPPGGKRDTRPPIDATFRGQFETAVQACGEAPKRTGMRVFVVGPKYDEGFQVALAHVESLINTLNRNGYKLRLAPLPDRRDVNKVEVRLYHY